MAADKAAGRVLLPDTVIPHRYELTLSPDLERFVFDGSAKIHVDVNEATSDVVLHAKELQISTATFQPKDGQEIALAAVSYNIKDMTVTLTFDEVLPVGPGAVSIDFVGCLNNQMAGFYRSCYKDINGETKVMASTQFESLDARRAFPCWDEPARKAVFAVTLVVDEGLAAFSNMPEKSSRSTTVGKKRKREIAFMDSPKMSTYLVAFVVGEVDFVQAKTEHGVLVRVYTPPGRSEAGQFALDVARKCLDLYDDFFGVPYPLPKLDMVAISEFAMGAMENWGLVTYREVDLLIDQKTASNQQKQRVAIVVTHELAHQWFGNLVTMAWWDDLWLNEGFASWCENYAADVIFPDYGFWEQFAADTLAAALRLDALKTSHAIQVPIKRAEEVEEVFDAISYCKGASVIRMAHAVLGHEAFRKGLQAYMLKHQYSNTETFHLWEAWAASSGKPVKEIMSSWTEQVGFPVVEVKAFAVEGSVAKLKLTQRRFLSSGEELGEEDAGKTWQLPLFLRTSKEKGKPAIMMTNREMDLEVPIAVDAGDAEFVMINEGMVTPARVHYTTEMRQRLSGAVRRGALQPADCVALVMDSWGLAKAGLLRADDAFRFLTGFGTNRDYVVWDALSAALLGFQKLLMGGAPQAVYDSYVAFAGQLVSRCWEASKLGWEPSASDGHTAGLLRGLLLKLTARFAAGPEFLAEARRRFERYLEDPKGNATILPDEYRVPVFQAVLAHGGEKEWRRLRDTFAKLETNVEQKHIFSAIGFAKDKALKLEALRWAISGEVKIQDFFYVIGSVSASSREGLDLAWGFLQENFAHIHRMVKDASPSIMDAVIQTSTGGYCSAAAAGEIEAFFEAHPLPLNKRTISQLLEEIRANAAYVDRILATDVVQPGFWERLSADAAAPPSSL